MTLALAPQDAPGSGLPPSLAGTHIVVGLPDPNVARGMVEEDEHGELDGFVPRLVRAAAERRKISVEFRPVHDGDGVTELLSHEVDIVCPVSITSDRLRQVDFSMPFLIGEGALFLRQDDPEPAALEDLRALRVRAAQFGIGHRFCLEKEIPVVATATLREALESVARGEADCVVTTRAAGRFEIERSGIRGLIDHPLDEAELRVAFAAALRPGDKLLATELNSGLSAVRDAGVWDELYDRWFARYQPREGGAVPSPALLSSLLSAGVLGLAMVFLLRARLRSRTRVLGETERCFRAVVESLPALYYSYFVGDDGRRERRLVTSNLARWTARFPALDPGADYRGILADMHPDDRARYELATAQARERRSRFDEEFRLRAADGGYRWLRSIALPVAVQGGTSWQSLLLDVTPLHELSEHRNLAPQELAAPPSGVAREFEGVLADVRAKLERARAELAPGSARRRVEEAEEAAGRARELAQRLLARRPPARDVEAEVAPAPGELRPAPRVAKSVLVVDDDAGVLRVTCAMLTNRGWSVASASEAREALRILVAQHPSVVLLDLTMPHTNGRELARLLRAERSGLPIVLTSGFLAPESSDPVEELDGFVQKPFTADQLEGALERALASRDGGLEARL